MSDMNDDSHIHDHASAPTAAVVHLSGPSRGRTDRISGQILRVGSSPTADIQVMPSDGEMVGSTHLTLTARGNTYQLHPVEGYPVFVNGELTEELVLASGDVIELGSGGPILRFRVYPTGSKAYKTVAGAFHDCWECAQKTGSGPLTRARIFFGGLVKEMLQEISPGSRVRTLGLTFLLVLLMGILGWRNVVLEQRFDMELDRVTELMDLQNRMGDSGLTVGELATLSQDLQNQLSEAADRLDQLESRAGGVSEVVSSAAPSTIFLQGGYGFHDGVTGRPVRVTVDNLGQLVSGPFGQPLFTFDGDGPLYQIPYTGTAFLVDSEEGLLLTNRHVALPWEFDETARSLIKGGFVGVMHEMRGYFPGMSNPVSLEFVAASAVGDLAILKPDSATMARTSFSALEPLHLSSVQPVPGDGVIVLGYPLGVRALLARSGPAILAELTREGLTDFWEVGELLGARGQVNPLASRGIVGQVTASAVVFDAETTSGGSGGPILNLDGEVVAITSAILPEFGGSNLGVPVSLAVELLGQVTQR